jgi:hypothetical protein
VNRSAWISDDQLYRYELRRQWGDGDEVVWIMSNPSTADVVTDDPTIVRCLGFSQAWGYGSLRVVNLYALRSPHPNHLDRCPQDPTGPHNRAHVAHILSTTADLIVAAWGARYPKRGPTPQNDHATRIAETLAGVDLDRVSCLGKTKHGAPCHPLYLPGEAVLEPWWP